MTLAPQSRFAFPDYGCAELREAILTLMSDGVPRSVLEIKQALGTQREIGARIRELRNGVYGPKHPFNDPRKDGAMSDGVFRYCLKGRG